VSKWRGPVMESRPGETPDPPPSDGYGIAAWREKRASDLAAIAELRRLIQDQQFRMAERVLAGHHDAGDAATVGTLRQLCVSGAEQLRVAAELESAANAQRVAAQEVRDGIAALLTVWERHLKAPAVHAVSPPVPVAGRGDGRPSRPWRIFSRGSAPQPNAEAWAGPGPPEPPAPAPLISMDPMSWTTPPAPAGAEVAACVLGPLDLTVAGQRVLKWSSLKARTVFQYLVVQIGRPVRREVLMELMWPDHSLSSARNNLNAALYSLRNTLSQYGRNVQYILHQDGCYLPNPELVWWIDRNEFLTVLQHGDLARGGAHPARAIDSYRRAVRLYRGPLFEDDNDSDWYLPEQRRLKELYLQALGHLTEMHLDLGDLTAAVQFGQLALSADQCYESVHRLLMRCYALQHQQQLVARQYRLCSAALQEELGVCPGADTVELFHRLTWSE
jgi:DNA-binding SARP family transcriptional activator